MDHVSKHLVVVEDNDLDYRALSRALDRTGYLFSVKRFARGDHCLEYLHSLKCSFPLAILLDLQVPVLSGEKVFAELQKEAQLSSIPIYIMSGVIRSLRVQQFLSEGAAGLVDKDALDSSLEKLIQSF